ncbi:sarcosine oxidase subunit gamma [Amycolatopsis cihanbeyliensis]|uniref:Sarcosine oxidase subunit gamma n=1 Tax=Amycolatopsis cihanbeyliensis TaxID=1128664 RepID=A0A542DEA0_AMYCI|nr:sarcosine oxidase subunit gamma family protein [Amycolatopsis cihanbeyliensis]TQJ01393.1 sarcosine oxidase subunit gamma [Amycolatopsis cihanbeyliensis]
MTADSALRSGTGYSPLAGWASSLGRLAPGVHALEQPMLTQLTLRLAGPGATATARATLGIDLPERPCTFTRGRLGEVEVEVLWMAPDEYLVLTPPGSATLAETLRTALDGAAAAVVDVSAQRTTLALSGPRVRDVLAHGCAIDLHPTAAPTGTCVQTLLARAGVVLLVRDAERAEFGLLVRSSFATYLAAWLVDASLEYREDQLSQ